MTLEEAVAPPTDDLAQDRPPGRDGIVGLPFSVASSPSRITGCGEEYGNMAGEVHRDMHHQQEHADAGGENDLESSGRAVTGCFVEIGVSK